MKHPIRPLVAAYLEFCDLDELSQTSCEVYRRNLLAWAAWRSAQGYPDAIENVSVQELRAHFSYLKNEHIPHSTNHRRPAVQGQIGLAPASRNLRWRILAGFWTFLAREGVLRRDQRDFFTAERIPRPSVPKTPRKSVEASVVRALLRVCDGSPEECWRDRAIILMLAQSGARVSELCEIREDRIDLGERCAEVVGKGGKPRTVFWSTSAAFALRIYLRHRRPSPHGWLFVGMSSRSKGHLSAGAVREMLKARAAAAGVTLPPGQPAHGFRRGFARRSIRRGMPGPALQQILGHATAAMLQLYAEEEDAAELRTTYRRYWDEDDGIIPLGDAAQAG